VIKSVVEKLEGHKVTVFLDKLGERLAFERTGARLYDALLAKYEAASVHPGGPTREQIEKIRDDEIRHLAIVRDAMLQLGADPTAMTPGADVIGVAGSGWAQVLSDPRSTLSQCLVVMLSAEVADGEGWQLLVTLAESLGFDDLATQFRTALVEEEQHAMQVRAWVTTSVLGQSGVRSGASQPDAI
jgi:rubrerythrin